MTTYTQQNRRIAIDTPLGKDALLLVKMSGREEMSRLFCFDLELRSERESIDPTDIIGKNVTITVYDESDEPRYFNGHISRFVYCGQDDRLSWYRAEVVPWLWFLTRRSDCRIFQDYTVPEIVEEVFNTLGLGHFDISGIQNHPPKREFCVQYRESDFDFVSRLLEEEGIFYFFEHENGKHTLILADQKAAYRTCAKAEFDFASPLTSAHISDEIMSWEHAYEYRSGRCAANDFCFARPDANLRTDADTLISLHQNGHLELYEYPGRYTDYGDGDRLIRVRMEEEETSHDTVHGESICRSFSPGYTFTMRRHQNPKEENRSYVLTSVFHNVEDRSYETGEASSGSDYQNKFTCVPDSIAFRPTRVTPKPIVRGSQTAFVVGPKGDEIYTDEYGRVKVQFHWDRYNEADEKSSCWIRVSQGWAGKNWGMIFLPRIGHEVVVDFLEGDPDRPIITGSVYNGEKMPPYPLPDNKTISTIKSLSSKDGGGFNEIRFEDKKDEEQIFVHAQKNLDLRVLNNRYETIEHDRHLHVENDKFEHVENDRHETVDRHHHEEVGKEYHLQVGDKQAIEIGDSMSLTVKGDVIEKFKGDHSSDVTGSLFLKGREVVIEALSGITLKVGGSHVVIDNSGVTVKGAMVTIDGNMTRINSGPGSPAGTGRAGNAISPVAPEEPYAADTADPGQMAEVKAEQIEQGKGKYGATPTTPFKESDEDKDDSKTSWIEIELLDEDDNPVPGEKYEIELPDGSTYSGTLDENGFACVDGIDPGTCKVMFPELDKSAWEQA